MFTINRWTKMYINGWLRNHCILLIMMTIMTIVILGISIYGVEPKNPVILTTDEQALIDKANIVQFDKKRNNNINLTNDEKIQLNKIREKIALGITPVDKNPKPESLTKEESNILLKYERFGIDGKTFVSEYRGNKNTIKIEPMSDGELKILAVAKSKDNALRKWHYEDVSASTSNVFTIALILPLFFIFIFAGIMFSSRTDLGRISQIRDMEKRMQQIRKYGAEAFIEKSNAKHLDANSQGVELYVSFDVLPPSNEGFTRDQKRPVNFVVYRDTSTGESYMSFVPTSCGTADEAMAWKQRITVEQYKGMVLQS